MHTSEDSDTMAVLDDRTSQSLARADIDRRAVGWHTECTHSTTESHIESGTEPVMVELLEDLPFMVGESEPGEERTQCRSRIRQIKWRPRTTSKKPPLSVHDMTVSVPVWTLLTPPSSRASLIANLLHYLLFFRTQVCG